MDRYFDTRVLSLGTYTFTDLASEHEAGLTQLVFERLIYYVWTRTYIIIISHETI